MDNQNFLAPGPTQAEFDTLNTQVQGLSDQIGTENLGSLATQSALESALVTLGGSMSVMQFKNVRFAFSSVQTSGFFKDKSGFYIGTFKKTNTNIYALDVQNNGTGAQKGEHITGVYNGSSWTWEDISDQIAQLVVYEDVSITFTSGGYGQIPKSAKTGYVPVASYIENGDSFTLTSAGGGSVWQTPQISSRASTTTTAKVVWVKV